MAGLGLSPTHLASEPRRQQTPSQQPVYAPQSNEGERPPSGHAARQILTNAPISFSGGGESQRPRSATSHLPFFSVGDVHNYVNYRGKLDQEVQTEDLPAPRFQLLRWMWHNRSFVLTVGILLAAMAFKLQEQSEVIVRLTATKDALKRSRDSIVLEHTERLAAAKEEMKADYDRLLKDHGRIHALELENCRLQNQREEEQARMEAKARRERVLQYRRVPELAGRPRFDV
jgi:hypothetical protein